MIHNEWTSEQWQDRARKWIAAEMSARGIEIGPITQPHVRPWSTVMRIETAGEPLWFKASAPALSYEARAVTLVARLKPNHVPRIVAVDEETGWFIAEDFGTPLRSFITSIGDIRLWLPVLDAYTAVQRAVARRPADLAQTGVPDRRSTALRLQWEELLGDTGILRIGQSGGLSADRYREAEGLWPRIADLLGELGRSGLPDTLVHEDLHDANVFVRDDRTIIADWGDSSIANPLVTLTVLMRSAAHRRDLATESPPVSALRNRVLDGWGDFSPRAVLERAARAAARLGMLHRALTWRSALSSASPDAVTEWSDAVPGWLDEFVASFH